MEKFAALDWARLRRSRWVSYLLDQEARILDSSALAIKHAGDDPTGTAFTDHFQCVRPGRVGSGSALLQHVGVLILATPRSGYLAIRGEIYPLRDSGLYVFVGSPWLTWIRDRHPEVNLGFADFPPSDAQVDMLFLMAAEQAHLRELEELTHDLERTRKAVVQSSQDQAELFAMMSHEMRTPLAGVISALQLVRDASMDRDEGDLIRSARVSAHNLLDVINQVLDYSKIESDSLPVINRAFNPRAIIETVRDVLGIASAQKELDLEFEIDPGVPHALVGDDRLIRQVLINLVNNAIKFTPSGGVHVEVRGEQQPDSRYRLLLTVSDTGPGIAESDRAHLFEKFWTMPAGGRSHPSGTGLGLYIVQRMLGLMNGTIRLDAGYFPGARFRVELTLPIAVVLPASDSRDDVDEHHGTRNLAGVVLLAEDNQTNQLLCKLTLQRMGIDVLVASNGVEVLDVLDGAAVDALLLDLDMPVLDGFETMRRLRSDERFRQLPVVALTAHSGSAYRVKATSLGFDDFLAKPSSDSELRRVLSRWLRSGGVSASATPGRAVPASVSAGSGRPLLDPVVIEQLIQDLGDQAGRVFELVSSEIPRRVAAIDEALQAMDLARIASETHSMKSTAASFGADDFAACCRALEDAARAGDNPRVIALAASLSGMTPDLLSAFERVATEAARGS